MCAHKFFQRNVKWVVAFGVATVDGAGDDIDDGRVVRRPGFLDGQFVFGQRASFVCGDGSDDADGLDGSHLMYQSFFGSHASHTQHQHNRYGNW